MKFSVFSFFNKKILNKKKKNVIIFKYGKGGVKMKKWVVSELDKKKVKELSGIYGIPVFTAMLLTIRGITEREEIEKYFSAESDLPDPFEIKDMDKAVDRIKIAVTNYEKICVYGDYDCDGVTSTALLYSYLDSVFADVMYYIPDRNSEGYGLNKKAIDNLKKLGVRLIVTVDNGIAAIDEVHYAGTLGIDVVVTDHHKPQDMLPNAIAVVDPHRNDDNSGFKDYCGAGIALMLASALEGDAFSIVENYSDLAAFGTIADLVPLTGVNRTIVKAGLFRLSNTERLGLSHLIDLAQISNMSAGNVAFRLAPRVNAAGRLGSAYNALDFFLTEDEEEAVKYADELTGLNVKRQTIENEIYEDICSMLDENNELIRDRVIVVSSEKWNPGVIGIVSSKITEKYGKPSIIISEGEQICKGSGRSIMGFSLVDAIFACSDLLEKFGGHPMAAGLSIKKENIPEFKKAINEYADRLEDMPMLTLRLDCNLNPDAIVMDMVHQLQSFEPFGFGNPKPVFGINNMTLDKITPLSGGKHIKLSVSRGKARLNLVKFSVSPEEFPYPEGSMLDFAVCLDINTYQNKEYISFQIKDIKPSDFDTQSAMHQIQLYESYLRGKLPKELADKYLTRNEFAAVYLYLKKHPQSVYSIDMLLSEIGCDTIGAFKLMIILDIFSELKLIAYKQQCDILKIEIINVDFKVDLELSHIYRKLKEDIEYVGKHT